MKKVERLFLKQVWVRKQKKMRCEKKAFPSDYFETDLNTFKIDPKVIRLTLNAHNLWPKRWRTQVEVQMFGTRTSLCEISTVLNFCHEDESSITIIYFLIKYFLHLTMSKLQPLFRRTFDFELPRVEFTDSFRLLLHKFSILQYAYRVFSDLAGLQWITNHR